MSETSKTACPLDCPDACSLVVEVDNGQVVSLDGDSRNPLTADFICGKVRRFADHVHGTERLRTPLVRNARGELADASWDEALTRVCEKMNAARSQHGGESILPLYYGGSNGYLTHGLVDQRLFRRLAASRLEATVCAAPSRVAAEGLYGRMTGVAPEDFRHARLILLWGANPSASGIHQVPPINAAMDAGARLVVVDPRRTPLARRADLHLPVRPGTDVVLALAVARLLFENGGADESFLATHCSEVDEYRERIAPWTPDQAAAVTGCDRDDIVRLAEWYRDTSPALVRCGWGPERNRNGGSAIAAVLALPAIAGKFGVRGGGYTMSNSSAWSIPQEELINAPEVATRVINMNRLGRALLDAQPPVDVLFVYNANPVATLPEQELVLRGLAREDLFTVVFEQVMTDTARHADVVLPATTFLEHRELARGYGSLAMQSIDPVIPAVGEARSNASVFSELIRRLGLAKDDDVTDEATLREGMLEGSGLDAAQRERLASREVVYPEEGQTPIQMVDVKPRTSDGRIHLVPPALDQEADGRLYAFRPEPDEKYSLALISPATSKTISSTFGQLDRNAAVVTLNADDAGARGVVQGAAVRVFNDSGEVRLEARVSDEVEAGVVMIPKGLWSHQTRNGKTANALCPDTYSDLGRGACFNDARVEVALLEEE